MKSSLYPIPGEKRSVEPLLEPYLAENVENEALEPDTLYTIALLGNRENTQEVVEHVRDTIEDYDERTQVANELDQISVINIDERRLDTFAVSLLYNLLEVDQTAPVSETLSRDEISDEDVRKIDYYLEKVNEYFETEIEQQKRDFTENLEQLFPVDLGDPDTASLYNTFEDRLAASKNARIDYLLFAKAASEERDRVYQFLKTVRERDLDSKLYMSPQSGSGGGYTRILEYGYDLRDGEFRSEFTTAIQKIETADDLEFRSTLRKLSSSPKLRLIYSADPALLRLITNQYSGAGSEMANLLVGTVNTIQVIEDNKSAIESEYQDAKQNLKSAIENLDTVYEQLEDHSDDFPSGKIQHDSGIVGDLEEFLRVAGRIQSQSAKFVFGYPREGRSSLFRTVAENIDARRQELESRESDLREHTQRITSLQERLETKLDDIDAAYETIGESTVHVELPEQRSVKRSLETQCNTLIDEVKSELPGLDFSQDSDSIREIQDEWDEELTETRQKVEDRFQKVNALERFATAVSNLESERDARREQIRALNKLMEENNE